MTYIGFAIKSGAVIKGMDDILRTKKRICLIVIAKSTQMNSRTKVVGFAEKKGISFVEIEDEILENLNLQGVKIVGITDKNLATAIISSIN